MKAVIYRNDQEFNIDLSKPIDISIPLRSGDENPNGFFIGPPSFEPFRAGSFVGSVALGGSANCEDISFNAHGNGTHTECVGHIARDRITINQCLRDFYALAQLISVQPSTNDKGDRVIMTADVMPGLDERCDALVIRTLPNDSGKQTRKYSGSNPTYLDAALAAKLASSGIRHLLIDLPSVDREEDSGLLLAHHAFWKYPHQPRMDATITEFIFVPDAIKDGLYLLNLQIASFESDASPSKPVLYELR